LDAVVLVERLKYLILLILSLTVHEFMHAWSAWKLGDDTAARMGRLTLNPIPHLDLFGTIIFPLLGMPIGWAKPVPVQPSRFSRKIGMAAGDILVSAAGPLANLGLAVISAVAFGLVRRFAPEATAPGGGVTELLTGLMLVNCGLMVFNLLPIPPLDGGHVAANLVPYRYRNAWDSFARYAPMVLLGLVLLGGATGTSVIWRVVGPPVIFVYRLLGYASDLIAFT
jgi:Zn-dependent protease